MDVKKNSPQPVPKKINISIRRSKSESKSKSKINSQQNSTEGPTVRSIFSNFSSNWKKNTKDPEKTETQNEAGPSTQIDVIVNKPSTIEIDSHPKSGLIATEKYADEYFMQHRYRGKAIILNHQTFDKEAQRNGTEKDVVKLTEVLRQLKFQVEVHTDLEYLDILELLKQLSTADYTDSDCIMFYVLTHGNKRRDISAKDMYYPVEKLWERFTADKCITLGGKPKLFFVNACRGKKKDSGLRLFHRGRTEADSPQKVQSYKIPNHADFLIAYSTVDGYLSYREIHNGSWFIQCFCDVLIEHYKTKDLMKMLTITARKVALDYRSQSDKAEDCELTQVPSTTSMLIRDIYFNT